MSRQEENWEFMTILNIPWHEASKIEDEADREFLLDKANEVKTMMRKQREAQIAQSMAEAETESSLLVP